MKTAKRNHISPSAGALPGEQSIKTSEGFQSLEQTRSLETGLTTGQAAFIEEARHDGRTFIEQPYGLYSDANHASWRRLWRRQESYWRRFANQRFLQGLDSLCLPHDRVPELADVNRFLSPRTGFVAKAVAGYVPAFVFFDCLRRREFPTTITIRDAARLDYLPEPDIFHDVAGHVPMHTDTAFADALVRFGDCAHTAAERVASLPDTADRVHILASIVRALARFFWFTIEFGLMRENEQIKAYGSGLLSSHGELEHALESPLVQRYPIQLEWVVNQGFEIDHYQPLLFVVDSFEHLFTLVDTLDHWMREGKLDNVAPGEPAVSEADLESFMEGVR